MIIKNPSNQRPILTLLVKRLQSVIFGCFYIEYQYLVKLLDEFAEVQDERIATFVMRNVLPTFVKRVKPDDILCHLEQQGVIE